MTGTVKQTESGSNVVAAAVDSGICRLQPSDGLFLQAAHLERMQDFARELALSIGVAAGAGVVHGYQAGLSETKAGTTSGTTSGTTCRTILTVGPGLAIDPSGRPLRSKSAVELPLDNLAVENDRFWIVQVMKGEPHLSGSENVYGNLCDDPCSSATIQPWADEGVIVQIVTDSFAGLSTVNPPALRRNWLASHYFERERANGDPWLVPGADGPTLSKPWSDGTPEPAPAAVPIAVLLHLPPQLWVLDVWTARRDMSAAPPQPAWQSRLGMRPWNIFIAQVLQFQAQSADRAAAATMQAPATEAGANIVKLIEEAVSAYNDTDVKPPKLGEALAALQGAEPAPVTETAPTLPQQGFAELPPAGFLPDPAGEKDPARYYTQLFGGSVDVRVCPSSADYALRAVEHAQHLDRIPLDQSKNRPKVDVLLPTELADLPALRTSQYGWAAYVRHRATTSDAAGQQSAHIPAEPGTPAGPGPRRAGTPAGPGPRRAGTPAGPGPRRAGTPAGPGPRRAGTPAGPGPRRAGTPAGPGPRRAGTPDSRAPKLPSPIWPLTLTLRALSQLARVDKPAGQEPGDDAVREQGVPDGQDPVGGEDERAAGPGQ